MFNVLDSLFIASPNPTYPHCDFVHFSRSSLLCDLWLKRCGLLISYAITGDPRADRCLLVTERLLLICTCTFSEASMLVPLLVKRKKPSRLRAHGVHKLERMTRLTQYLYYYTYIDRSRLP
jgi:hypothetical protein